MVIKEEHVAIFFNLAEFRLPVMSLRVARVTKKVLMLCKVFQLVSQGLPKRLGSEDPDLIPFFN